MPSDPFIPYGSQWTDADDAAAVAEAVRADLLTTGPKVQDFEQAVAAVAGAAHVVAVNSGTAALHAAYAGLGLGPGDELVTTPLTFAATSNAALYLGAEVRFVDVEPDTGNIDPAAVEAAIGPRTKLVAAVDFTGHPADYDRLRTITSRHDVRLVADAAHSIGATLDGRPVGSLADATTFSFHPVKAFTTGEGGAIATDDADVALRMREFRNHGLTRVRSGSGAMRGLVLRDAGPRLQLPAHGHSVRPRARSAPQARCVRRAAARHRSDVR